MTHLSLDPNAPLAQDAATFLRELSELQAKSQTRRRRLEQLQSEQTQLSATLASVEARLLKAQWHRAQAAEEVLRAQVACAELTVATSTCKSAMQELLQRRCEVCDARRALAAQTSADIASEVAKSNDSSLSPSLPSPLRRTVCALREHDALRRHCFAALLDEVRLLCAASEVQCRSGATEACAGGEPTARDASVMLHCVREAGSLSDDEYELLTMLLGQHTSPAMHS